jgi:hypothetical protein
MSSRLIRKQTGLTFEPSDAPGVVVEYTLHPEQPFKSATRDSEGQEHIPARVEVETVTIGGLSEGVRGLMFDILHFISRQDPSSTALNLTDRINELLASKPIDFFPWLQAHGADEDDVIAKLEEGILTGHRE